MYMTSAIDSILYELPHIVVWSDVGEVERFDERFGGVNEVVGPIMDVTREYVALTTDDTPSRDELIAWAWLIRPSLGVQLREIASHAMSRIIDSYGPIK
jgi:hypothetical protein